MCFMIAVGVARAEVDCLRMNSSYKLGPAPSYVSVAFREADAVFVMNVGHCGCDRFTEPLNKEGASKLRSKYAQKGWKDGRIDRTILEHSKLGGLDLGLIQNITTAASYVSRFSFHVYWDDGLTAPVGSPIQVRADQLTAERSIVRSGHRVDIVRDTSRAS